MALWGGGGGGRSVINEAVLAELRAIRAEIHDLAERVGQSATRTDLDQYIRKDVFLEATAGHQQAFADHLRWHRSLGEGWRVWAPFVLAGAAFLWSVFWSTLGQHLTLR